MSHMCQTKPQSFSQAELSPIFNPELNQILTLTLRKNPEEKLTILLKPTQTQTIEGVICLDESETFQTQLKRDS